MPAASLIVVWAASLALLAGSYFVGLRTPLGMDLVGHYVCRFVDCQGPYPSFEPRTWVTYLIYSLLALMLIQAVHVIWAVFSRPVAIGGQPVVSVARDEDEPYVAGDEGMSPLGKKSEEWAEPHAVAVVTINTVLMTLLYGASTLPH